MKRTYQIRVGEEWHKYARKISESTGKSITSITEEALKMHSGIYQQEKEELDAQFRAIFPDHRSSAVGQKTPKPPSAAEMSTRIKEIRKALKTGELWTSEKYSADNVRKLFES